MKAATSPPIHAVVGSVAMSSVHMVWIPLASALVGAVAGAVIGAWAVFRNTKEEWRRKQAQARRALQIEMYNNALILKAATGTLSAKRLNDVLAKHTFSLAFRAYFTEASEGVSWRDVRHVLAAYSLAQILLDGGPIRGLRGESVKRQATKSVGRFCKAIRAMSRYERLEDSFYKGVEKLERWLVSANQPTAPGTS